MAITKTDVYDVQAPFPLDLRNIKSDVNGRNNIAINARYIGLTCYTLTENTLWRLVGGTDNSNWVDWGGATGGIQTVIVNTGTPRGGNNGDIWLRNTSNGTEVWQKVNDSWANLGVISGTINEPVINNSLGLSETSISLNILYPSSMPGFTVISKTAGIKYMKIDNTDWEQIGVVIV